MKPTLKRLLAALFSLMLVLSAALALPAILGAVMEGSFRTQVSFAEVYPIPSLIPVQPTPVEARPTVTQETGENQPFPIASPAPAALPIQHHTGDSLPPKPLTWRDMISPISGETWAAWAKSLNLPEHVAKTIQSDISVNRFYRLPGGEACLAETREPQDLAQQKLLQGILQNLESSPYFIPDARVLDQVKNLPMSAVALSRDGSYSTLMITREQTLPLAVMQSLLGKGIRTAAFSEYTGELDQMFVSAAELLTQDISSAMNKSAALVGEMMWNEEPWQLSIIQMTPYTFGGTWDYYLAGHHVKALDMKTGDSYTLTTDLISGKVVGIATEGSEPFLTTYHNLITYADNFNRIAQNDRDAILESAIRLGSNLAKVDLGQAAWISSITPTFTGEGNIMNWEVAFNPEDEEERLMDPDNPFYMSYRITLDPDHRFLAFNAQRSPMKASNAQGFSLSDDSLETNVTSYLMAIYPYEKTQNHILSILENRNHFIEQGIALITATFPDMQPAEIKQFYLEEQEFQNGNFIPQSHFVISLSDNEGQLYDAYIAVEWDDTFWISSITAQKTV